MKMMKDIAKSWKFKARSLKLEDEERKSEEICSFQSRLLYVLNNKCRLTTNNKDTTNKLVACSSRPRRTVGISAMLQRTVPFLPTSFNSLKGTVAEGSKEMRGKENNESCLPASNSRFEIKNKTEITNKLVARSSRLKI